jgi:peptidoglycan/xylan/chitin deacetylase (PgdA/CDA1 family)
MGGVESTLKGTALPDNAVFVSFDDGWRNNLTLAAPLLKKYEIPATVFLTTDYIGTQRELFWAMEFRERVISFPEIQIVLQGQRYELPPVESVERIILSDKLTEKVKRLPIEERNALLEMLRNKTTLDFSPKWKQELYEFLSWDEVRTLQRKNWTIGCHTLTHPILSMLHTEELTKELNESKTKIETELGEPCETLAYPNGSKDDYNEETIAVAKRLGFQAAFTLENRRNTETFDPMRIHRICITRDLTLNSFRAIISGVRGM